MTIAINKRKKYLSWVLLVVTGLIAVGAAIKARDAPARDVQQFEEEVATQLPLGTHRDAVKKWISARGYDQRFSKAEMQNSRGIVSCIEARVPKTYFWYGKGGIEIWFSFDDKHKLVSVLVRWSSLFW
ncbi:MAG: hypothetical protein HYS12_29170 [Planctomycetes bacterium]|nr:hypothetical protein [Planctomycetota bacterium]